MWTNTLETYLNQHFKEIQNELNCCALSLYACDWIHQEALLVTYWGEKPREKDHFSHGPLGQCALSAKPLSIKVNHSSRPDKFQAKAYFPLLHQKSTQAILLVSSKQIDYFDSETVLASIHALSLQLEKLLAQAAENSLAQ